LIIVLLVLLVSADELVTAHVTSDCVVDAQRWRVSQTSYLQQQQQQQH
jgi:hypothetical protein